MASGATQPGYERCMSQSHSHAFNSTECPPIELPRPLEPRPMHQLHSSTPEASSFHARHESYREPAAMHPDSRQKLPGVRDLLIPGPPISLRPYGPSLDAHHGEPYHHPRPLHPPMALYPPPGPPSTISSYPPRGLELPILETSPVSRYFPHSVPTTPYGGLPETREYVEARREGQRPYSNASYAANLVHSPYASAGAAESRYAASAVSVEQSASPSLNRSVDPQKQYLGTRNVPGEGAFHVWEDGRRLPTHVDGEQVNPVWGLTKANKPRKRLAVACLDCREKKIKCEPGAESCLQCEKAKRPCRRAPTQLSQVESPTSSTWLGMTGSPVPMAAPDSTPSRNDCDPDTAIKRRTRDASSSPDAPTKKHRSASPVLSAQFGGMSSVDRFARGDMTSSHSTLSWEEDPYSVDRGATLHLLDLYFTHMNSTTYCMLPRRTFWRWVESCPKKCQLERMMLYSVLAMGSIFADSSYSGFGKCCAEIASSAIATKTVRFKLTIVQTRLILALWNFAKGNYGAAWDHSGLALRAATSVELRFNTEEGCIDDQDSQMQSRLEFMFTKAQFAECKRRTFWSCFLIDRFCRGTLCVLDPADVFLRLPCADEVFEDGSQASDAPFYNNDIIDPETTVLTPSSPISSMALLVLIAAIWGKVLNFNNRAVHRPNSTYRATYESFYADTHNAMQSWTSRLPDHLQYSQENLERSIREGYADKFITLHAIYHFTLMKLNRYVRHAAMMDLVPRNIRAAHFHAHALLSIMTDLYRTKRDVTESTNGQLPPVVFSASFPGYTILSAIDVAGAGGLDSTLRSTLEAIEGGLECLQELSRFWDSGRSQLRDARTRFYQIKNIVSRPYKSQSGAWLGRNWGTAASLDKEFKGDNDCIYGNTDDPAYAQCYFNALRDGKGDDAGALRIIA